MLRAAALVAVLAGTAHADRRIFTQPFQYGTEAPDDTSFTFWHTEARPAFDARTTYLDFKLQLQQGLTEHWDAALYTTFVERTSTGFAFGEVRLQNRYRFVDRSEWPVDVQLQLDLAKQHATSSYEAAARLVLARDLDALSLAANALVLRTFGNDVDGELQLWWSAGASYELHPKLNVGVESLGRIDPNAVAVGPVISVAPSNRVWLTLGGLMDGEREVLVRALVGIEL